MIKPINTANRFYSKNYLTSYCDFGGQNAEEIKYLCDSDPFGQNTYTAEEGDSFTVWFKDDYGVNCARLIDTVILQNHNLEAFTVTLANNMDNVAEKIITANAASNNIIVLDSAVNATHIIFTFNKAFEGSLCYMGQLRICKFITELSATTKTEIKPVIEEASLRTYSGRLISWTTYEKWGAKISVDNLSKPCLNSIQSFIKSGGYITIVPWFDYEPKDIYECRLTRASAGSYGVNRYTGLAEQTLTLEAKEGCCA